MNAEAFAAVAPSPPHVVHFASALGDRTACGLVADDAAHVRIVSPRITCEACLAKLVEQTHDEMCECAVCARSGGAA